MAEYPSNDSKTSHNSSTKELCATTEEETYTQKLVYESAKFTCLPYCRLHNEQRLPRALHEMMYL